MKKYLLHQAQSWPSFSEEEIKAVSNVLQSGKVNYWTGKQARLFEQEFSQFSACKYAVAMSNGTVALDTALKVLEIGKGDEVVVTSRTFIASISSIVNSGAIPIFSDVDLSQANIAKLPWYYNVSSWDGLKKWLSSENKLDKPPDFILSYNEWNPLGTEVEEDE